MFFASTIVIKANPEFLVFCENDNYYIVFKNSLNSQETINFLKRIDSVVYFGCHDELRSLMSFGLHCSYFDLQHCVWNKDTSKVNLSLQDILMDKEYEDYALDLNRLFLNCFFYSDCKAVKEINKNDSIYSDIKKLFDFYKLLYTYSSKNNFYCNVIDNELCENILKLENNGIPLNFNYLKSLRIIINRRLESIISSIYSITGCSFNINSTRELNFVLNKLGVVSSNFSSKELETGYNDTGLLLFKYISEYRKLTLCCDQYVKPLYESALKDGFGRFKYKTCNVPCLTRGHKCIIKDIGVVDISEVSVGQKIWTEHGFKKITNLKPYKTDKLIRVYLANGITITGSSHHPILINTAKNPYKNNKFYSIERRWVSLENLFIGERVICNSNYECLKNENALEDVKLKLSSLIYYYANIVNDKFVLSGIRVSDSLGISELKTMFDMLGIKVTNLCVCAETNTYDIIVCDKFYVKKLKLSLHERLSRKSLDLINSYLSGCKDEFSLNKLIRDENGFRVNDYEESSVIKIENINLIQTVFDIEVEDVHEYNANGVIHHNTGRISSCRALYNSNKMFTNINMQSVPKTELVEGINLRKCFIPNKGCYWVTFDIKAQEVRLASYLYNIKKIKEINLDSDIYLEILRYFTFINNTTLSNEDKRKIIKIVTLGLIYGLSNYGIERQLKSSNIDIGSVDYRSEFYNLFPELEIGQKKTIWYAHQVGGVYTMSGRFRKIDFNSKDKSDFLTRNNRIALNTVIQGVCGDIMRMIINNVEKEITPCYGKYGFSLLNSIHDEINVSIPKDRELFEEIKKKILSIITTPKSFDGLCFGCKVTVKDNWGEQERDLCQMNC